MNWTPHKINSEVVYQPSGGYPNVTIPCTKGKDFLPFPYTTSNHSFISNNECDLSKWKEQRKIDQEFIEKFLSNFQKKTCNIKRNSMKISEAKQIFLDIINLKKQIEEKANCLDVNSKKFEMHWMVIAQQMNEVDQKILNLQINIGPLKSSILKRLKHRQARKKRKAEKVTLKEVSKKEIERKHAIIDKLLSERNDEVESIKREAALKRQADTVLHEVRKKKYEANKTLNLLSKLAKLRELRLREEEKQGGYCSKQLTDTFNEVISRFHNLWEKQLEVYKLEEKGLKMMLEENALPPVKESKFETNLLQWEKALFGDVSTDDYKYLTDFELNMGALIQIRQEWDQFITLESTAMSSGIPMGWVLPPETNNEDWKQFLAKTKTSLKFDSN